VKAISITVTGKVQGVFFRQSTLEKALELGIKGFVKNMPDGSVYIEAEGDGTALAALIEWCKQGPEMAAVSVLVAEKQLICYKDFQILK
jgi:acylphosphatase